MVKSPSSYNKIFVRPTYTFYVMYKHHSLSLNQPVTLTPTIEKVKFLWFTKYVLFNLLHNLSKKYHRNQNTVNCTNNWNQKTSLCTKKTSRLRADSFVSDKTTPSVNRTLIWLINSLCFITNFTAVFTHSVLSATKPCQ